MRRAPQITLSASQRKQLHGYARGRRVAVRLALRAKIILLAAEDWQNKQIAAQLSVSRQLAARWRKRFLQAGIRGIEKDAPRPGRKPRPDPRQGATDHPPNNPTAPAQRHPLEPQLDGSTGRRQPLHRGPHLARPRSQAPSREDLQTQQRPAFRRETRRHRRTLSASARACSGTLAR